MGYYRRVALSDSGQLLVQAMNRKAKFLSRNHLSSAVIGNSPKIQDMIADELESIHGISLTFDIWTARKSARGFGVVTAHYVSEEGALNSVVLKFTYIPCPHDTNRTLDLLKSVIEEYGIAGNVVSITTDSASTDLSAIKKLQKWRNLGADTKVGFYHILVVSPTYCTTL